MCKHGIFLFYCVSLQLLMFLHVCINKIGVSVAVRSNKMGVAVAGGYYMLHIDRHSEVGNAHPELFIYLFHVGRYIHGVAIISACCMAMVLELLHIDRHSEVGTAHPELFIYLYHAGFRRYILFFFVIIGGFRM